MSWELSEADAWDSDGDLFSYRRGIECRLDSWSLEKWECCGLERNDAAASAFNQTSSVCGSERDEGEELLFQVLNQFKVKSDRFIQKKKKKTHTLYIRPLQLTFWLNHVTVGGFKCCQVLLSQTFLQICKRQKHTGLYHSHFSGVECPGPDALSPDDLPSPAPHLSVPEFTPRRSGVLLFVDLPLFGRLHHIFVDKFLLLQMFQLQNYQCCTTLYF